MTPSNSISEGNLGMTKAALRKSPNADARSVNGKIMLRLNSITAALARMPPDQIEKLL
jgi:hypothetical protein